MQPWEPWKTLFPVLELPVQLTPGTKYRAKLSGEVFTIVEVRFNQDQVFVRSDMTGRLYVWTLLAFHSPHIRPVDHRVPEKIGRILLFLAALALLGLFDIFVLHR